MTDKEKAIYEHQIDLERAFLSGFMASRDNFNAERFCWDRNKIHYDSRYTKSLDKFKKGEE